MNPLTRALAISQLVILGCWEAIGLIAYDWNPWIIAAIWFVGLWTFNVLVASGVYTYSSMLRPPKIDNIVNVSDKDA